MTSLTEIKDAMMPTGGILLSETEIQPGVIRQEYILPNGEIVEIEGTTTTP
jgi:hypothetical protein